MSTPARSRGEEAAYHARLALASTKDARHLLSGDAEAIELASAAEDSLVKLHRHIAHRQEQIIKSSSRNDG